MALTKFSNSQLDIVCIVDISGSMGACFVLCNDLIMSTRTCIIALDQIMVFCACFTGAEAKLATATGSTESHGLSLLDIVKHAVRTIVHSLRSTDRLSVVAYTTAARVIFPLLDMDDAGKQVGLHISSCDVIFVCNAKITFYL